MEKNELTFGVEIEYKTATAGKVQKKLQELGIASKIEGYHHNTNFDVWKICSDSSVSYGRGRTMRGGELVSPILTLNDLDQIDTVCSALKECEAIVDMRCGLHVHFSWNGIQEDGKIIKNLDKIC